MAQPKPRSGPSLAVLVVSMLAVVVGFLAFTQINSSSTGPEMQIIWGLVAAVSFGFVVFSVFRVSRVSSMARVIPHKVMSVVRCPQCSFKQIKNFAMGDYVFKSEGKCTQCGVGSLFINGIYTEDLKRR